MVSSGSDSAAPLHLQRPIRHREAEGNADLCTEGWFRSLGYRFRVPSGGVQARMRCRALEKGDPSGLFIMLPVCAPSTVEDQRGWGAPSRLGGVHVQEFWYDGPGRMGGFFFLTFVPIRALPLSLLVVVVKE